MTPRNGLLAVFAALTCSCATVAPGERLDDAMMGGLSSVSNQVAFDHGCGRDRIRVIRGDERSVDLDVCGVVRRYKPFASGLALGVTWLDVTSLYPASALPAPLPSR